MNDLDPLFDRLHRLGRAAPVPAADPLDDIRRGRGALRRRRARVAGGIATALVTVGVVSAAVVALDAPGSPGVPDETDHPFVQAASHATSALCLEELSRMDRLKGAAGQGSGESVRVESDVPRRPPWQHPAVAAQVIAYRQATAAILDPSGTHLDDAVTNLQYSCNPLNGKLARIGTKLGWTSSGALGVVQLEIVAPGLDEDPQIVMQHDHWTAIKSDLPGGVITASVAEYPGGHAVLAKRQDGLTVVVDANGTWGNNVAPGSPPASDLPSTGKLLQLAASKSLVLPEN